VRWYASSACTKVKTRVGSQGSSYPLVLGVSGASKSLTLYHAYSSGAHIGALLQQRLSIGLVFVGAHFKEDELSFAELKQNAGEPREGTVEVEADLASAEQQVPCNR